jgi:hypothetical protein
MRRYRPGHEPVEWPLWQDLAIVGIVLFLLYAMGSAIIDDHPHQREPAYQPLVEVPPK